MNGREEINSNNLFYLCGLIACIARKTKNMPGDVVRYLGRRKLEKIYSLADVYHCEPLEQVSEDFIREKSIPTGTFDNVDACHYSLPTCWDIGKVYKRLILMLDADEQNGILDSLEKVYTSRVSALIENYNGSFYYENPGTIYATYLNGGIPE